MQTLVKLLTLNDYQPDLSGGVEFMQAGLVTRGISLCWWQDGVRTSLLAAAQGLAGEVAVLRTVERDGGRVRCEGNRRQDLKKGEVKLNSLSQLTDVILLHLEAIGVAWNKQICLPPGPSQPYHLHR